METITEHSFVPPGGTTKLYQSPSGGNTAGRFPRSAGVSPRVPACVQALLGSCSAASPRVWCESHSISESNHQNESSIAVGPQAVLPLTGGQMGLRKLWRCSKSGIPLGE